MIHLTTTGNGRHWMYCSQDKQTTTGAPLALVVAETLRHVEVHHQGDTRKVKITMDVSQLAELNALISEGS